MSIPRSLARPLSKPGWVCDRCIADLSARSSSVRQRRWLSQNHARKVVIADEEWKQRKLDIEAGKKKSMLDVLEERGYVNQIVGTRDGLNNLLNEQRVGVYVGVDPTAPSLHVGHMVPFMAMGWMFIHGYSAVYLLGGFTASIGDPIGRLTGRKPQTLAERNTNAYSMHLQLKQLSASTQQYAHRKGIMKEWAWRRAVKNNYYWWQKLTMNDFMKTMGLGTRLGPMLGRDTVKNRLESGEGMSFAEFTYPLVQAWDWWHLYREGVRIQIGGGDQFGNILAGAEAVKYMINNDVNWINREKSTSLEVETTKITDPMGFTVPLITTSSGEKFGKSAGNAIWLDPNMTSSFDLYQFFLRSADADVEKYLKLFTFIPLPEIKEIMKEQNEAPEKRVAQHRLAVEFVELAHGYAAAKRAEAQHTATYNKSATITSLFDSLRASKEAEIDASTVRPADINPSLNKHAAPLDMHSAGPTSIKLPESLVIQQPLSRILWSAGLVASRSEGQRLINNKGVYVGGRSGKGGTQPMGDVLNYAQIEDPKWSNVSQFVLDDHVLILRTGKWRVKIIEIIPDPTYTALGLDCPGWKELQEETIPPSEDSNPDVQTQSSYDLDLQEEEKYRHEQLQTQDKSHASDRTRQTNVYNPGSSIHEFSPKPPSSSSRQRYIKPRDESFQASLQFDSDRTSSFNKSYITEQRQRRRDEDQKTHLRPEDLGAQGRMKIGDSIKERPLAGGLGVRLYPNSGSGRKQ